MAENDILAWGASYLGGENGLAAAFAALVDEGLFFRVLYPIFAVPVYFCSYAIELLDELPESIEAVIVGSESIAALKVSWKTKWDENTKEYGPAWMCWGVCDGQGDVDNHSGLDAMIGPCLGPGCFWFTNGDASCEWNLPFANVRREGWPQTAFLLGGCGTDADVIRTQRCMEALQQAAPDFPWPTQ